MRLVLFEGPGAGNLDGVAVMAPGGVQAEYQGKGNAFRSARGSLAVEVRGSGRRK